MKLIQFRMVAALGIVGALGLGMSAIAAPGTAQQKGDQAGGPPINTPMSPWTGEMGIVETVSDIMARELATPIYEVPPPLYLGREHEIDRSGVRQNPTSPRVSSWPLSGRVGPKAFGGGPGRGGGAYNPQTIGTSFDGVVLGESGNIPPDSNGAVGPTQILFCENGRIKVFSRSGVLGALNTTTDTFFNSVRNGSGTSDPEVRFDPTSGRWFVSIINVSSPNRILLAVSSGTTITGTTSFTFFQFQQDLVAPAGDTGQLADYVSLGVDANALYMGANMFGATFTGTTAWVVKKSSVLGVGPIQVTAFRGLGTGAVSGPYAPRGVDNDDPTATEGYVIGVDTLTFGTLYMRRITNPGGTPSISGNLVVVVPTTGNSQTVSVLGSTRPLDGIDDRLYAASMHKNTLTGVSTLWTAHSFEVGATGVASSVGNRLGSRWYELQNMTGAPSLKQSGTLFDSAATNPRNYWFPSVAMSGQGHMALGSSTAGLAARADVSAAGRLSSDALGTIQAPTHTTASVGNYNVQTSGTQRWGDYSATHVDPVDRMTMWTFQEWCNATNSWAVRVVELKAPTPATITTLTPSSILQGQTLNIVVAGSSTSGSGFYWNPDTYSWSRNIAAAFSGSGVTVNSIVFNSPTQITLNVTASAGAATGARDLTVTNPDLQLNTKVSALTVNAGGPATITPATAVINPGLLDGGGVADLWTSNNVYMIGKRNLAQDELGSPITLTVTGTSPVAVPTAMQFRVESRASVTGIQQAMDLWDWTTSTWVTIDTRFVGVTDGVVTISAPGGLARFVQTGTRALRARVRMDEIAADTLEAWRTHFDQVVWLITS